MQGVVLNKINNRGNIGGIVNSQVNSGSSTGTMTRTADIADLTAALWAVSNDVKGVKRKVGLALSMLCCAKAGC